MLFRDTPAEPPNKKKIKWTPSYTFETGVGFSDNPLYGPFVQEEATFWENSLEGFYLIESQPEFFTYLYLYGEGKFMKNYPSIIQTLFILDNSNTPIPQVNQVILTVFGSGIPITTKHLISLN